jgi:heat shock protein HslJ
MDFKKFDMKISRLVLIAYFSISLLNSCANKRDQLNNIDLNNLNGTWFLDMFIDKQEIDTFYLPADYSASISFQGENCIVVFGPCNSGQGRFVCNENKITVSNLSLTERGCQILGYEETFTNNLSGVYLIKGDTLKITSNYETNLIFYKSDTTIHYQCNEENLSTGLIIDSLLTDRYYSNEIFNTQNTLIYGKWLLEEISGGLHGGGYEPDFDYFEIKSIGIYGLIRNDSLLEYGKIRIDEQTAMSLLISLIPDNNSDTFLFDTEKYVDFYGTDTLELRAPCCDRYNYHFKRIK